MSQAELEVRRCRQRAEQLRRQLDEAVRRLEEVQQGVERALVQFAKRNGRTTRKIRKVEP